MTDSLAGVENELFKPGESTSLFRRQFEINQSSSEPFCLPGSEGNPGSHPD
jgi:hypothetical protein